MYLSLQCHHQNDSCIKMGSDESHFNVSLIVRDKVTRQRPIAGQLPFRFQPRKQLHPLRQASESKRDQEEGGELDSHKVRFSFAGPGEIKRREVVLDPQESPEEIKSREMELGSESWTSFGSVVPQQLRYGHCPCDSAPYSS